MEPARGHKSPTGDYTGSYEDTGGGALPYNVASKTVCNCTNNLTFMDNVNHKGFDNSITVVVFFLYTQLVK